MIDVAIRLVVAATVGALLRMLEVFGLLPGPILWCGLAVAGGLLSWRLVASRLFVVLLVSGGHFVTYLLTLSANVRPSEITDSPSAWTLVWNAVQLFVPFALPALGSIVGLRLEMRKKKEEEPEITEESLLKEEIPSVRPELTYDSTDFD